jgi:3-oxoacyl-[acyl-carrier-protein] synthase III
VNVEAPMNPLTARLLSLAHQVQTELGRPPSGNAETPLGDMFDSMGLVEYLLVVAEALGVSVEELERSAGRQFSTIGELEGCLLAAADRSRTGESALTRDPLSAPPECWLAGMAVRLPARIQTAAEIDGLLGRPPGWWQAHAGIGQRRIWGDEDALAEAATAARDSLAAAALTPADLDLLLTVSEAPPLLAGLAAAVHARLELPAHVPALELGNACSGFLTALWLARALLPQHRRVLIVCVEAPSRFLRLEPGPAGEAAALFSDAAAACVVTSSVVTSSVGTSTVGTSTVGISNVVTSNITSNVGPSTVLASASAPTRLLDLQLQTDGASADLIQVECRAGAGVEVHLQGPRLTAAAVRAMAEGGRALLARRHLAVGDLAAVVMHAGNGRFPALLARALGMPPQLVRSRTARDGNLGSASLPAAWLSSPAPARGLVLWTAVGAGITSAAALTQVDAASP